MDRTSVSSYADNAQLLHEAHTTCQDNKDALIRSALCHFDNVCKRRGYLLHAPIPHHVCTSRCRLVEYTSRALGKAFVCSLSRNVHVCGAGCNEAEQTNEAWVCRLTGHEVPIPNELFYVKRSKENPRAFVAPPPTRMGKSGMSRKLSKATFDMDKCKKFIHRVFNGKERHMYYMSTKKTVFDVVEKIKKDAHRRGRINFLDANKRIFKLAGKLFKKSFAKPTEISDKNVEAVAKAIHTIWKNSKSAQQSKSSNSTIVLTALCLTKFKTGHTISGTVFLPKIEWIAQLSPDDSFYSNIPEIRCRSMSLLWRKILEESVDGRSALLRKDITLN